MKGVIFGAALLASAASSVLAADLGIDTTKAVECKRKTQNGDSIQVHYRGTLQSNGNKFDASYDRGKPFTFKLGGGQVIKGWDQGLLDMCPGEKRTLTVPPEYGYGQRSIGSIPAGSTLIFETELMGIDGVEPEIIESASAVASDASETASSVATEATDSASSVVSKAASSATEKIAEKIASKVADAADAAKTMLADTDDSQEHNEL